MTAQRTALTIPIGYEALTALPTAAMPPFLGQYVEQLGYGLDQAGRIASAETIGMATGQAIVLLAFTREAWNLRRSVLVAMLVFATAQALSAFAPNLATFTFARFLSGLTGGGIVFATAGLYIASLPRPDRPYSVFYGILFVVGPIGLFSLPGLFDSIGIKYVYLGLGGLTLLSLLAIGAYPEKRLDRLPNKPGGAAGRLAPAALACLALLLISLFINYVSNGGVWVYLERIGAAMAVEPASRGGMLAFGMACGVIGSLAAIACAERLNRYAWITAGQVLLLGSYIALLKGSSPAAFLAAAILLNVAVTFYTPFYLAQLSTIDPKGRGATLGMLAFGFGYGLGPALLSLFLVDGNFSGLIIAAAVAVMISLALLWAAAFFAGVSVRQHHRSPASNPHPEPEHSD